MSVSALAATQGSVCVSVLIYFPFINRSLPCFLSASILNRQTPRCMRCLGAVSWSRSLRLYSPMYTRRVWWLFSWMKRTEGILRQQKSNPVETVTYIEDFIGWEPGTRVFWILQACFVITWLHLLLPTLVFPGINFMGNWWVVLYLVWETPVDEYNQGCNIKFNVRQPSFS